MLPSNTILIADENCMKYISSAVKSYIFRQVRSQDFFSFLGTGGLSVKFVVKTIIYSFLVKSFKNFRGGGVQTPPTSPGHVPVFCISTYIQFQIQFNCIISSKYDFY